MELTEYLTVLRQYWVSVVAVFLAGIAAGALVSLMTTPAYTASTAIFFTVQSGSCLLYTSRCV